MQQAPKMTVDTALKQVLADIKAMSPVELRAELEKHKNGDIAVAMRELNSSVVSLDSELSQLVDKEFWNLTGHNPNGIPTGTLTDAALADPEFTRAYVEELQDTIIELLGTIKARPPTTLSRERILEIANGDREQKYHSGPVNYVQFAEAILKAANEAAGDTDE